MDLTVHQIKGIKESACIAHLGSLDSPVKGLDGGVDTTVGDMVASAEDIEGDAVERMQREQLCAVLWECVDSLPRQQTEVIRKRYQGGMTLGAIGQEYGTTPEAVRQIQTKALRELRNHNNQKLKGYFHDILSPGSGENEPWGTTGAIGLNPE